MRNLAYIEKIKALKPIANADSIECAEVLGWEVVVRKGEFKENDLIIYVEVDAILPELPPFEFLRPKKFRIKIVKLRGQVSMGIVFPLSILTQVDPTFNTSHLQVGQDMTDTLQITKYDPEALLDTDPSQPKKSWLANKYSFLKWKLFGIKPRQRDDFPHDVPKTDETRVQKMGGLLFEKAGAPAYITEKVEGTSATFVYRRGGNWLSRLFGNAYVFHACSRNRILSPSDGTHPILQVAAKYNIQHKLHKLNRNLALQGEVIGPKIQGNVYKLPEPELRVFSIFDLDKKAYVPYTELVSLVEALDLPMVPVLDTNAVVHLVQNDIKHYVELSKGKSQIRPGVLREGIVIRGLNSEFSFKSINPEYLLKQE